jgi:hypothetical protein
MIQNLDVPHNEWRKNIRQTWKENWVSSVELSGYGINTKKLRQLCDRSEHYHAMCFNISGSIKYWFAKRFIYEMIEISGQKIGNYNKA